MLINKEHLRTQALVRAARDGSSVTARETARLARDHEARLDTILDELLSREGPGSLIDDIRNAREPTPTELEQVTRRTPRPD